MNNPFTLNGKVILVTGASSGIGRATACECAKLGARLIITGRDAERLNETFLQLEGSNHVQIVVDLITENVLQLLVEKLPSLNGVVHCAGMTKTLPLPFINKKELQIVFDINFFAPVILSQLLIKKNKIVREGSIVFISSIDGPVTVHPGNSMYAASKGAVTAMVKGMAIDLASKKIRVNSVLPGMTDTPLIHKGSFTQEQLTADMNLYPLKRFAKPEEIAYAVIYFLSDASAWTTGTGLVVDGGFTLL